jgi:hypothetical protein
MYRRFFCNVGEKAYALTNGRAAICPTMQRYFSMASIFLYTAGRRNRASALIGFVFLELVSLGKVA